MPADDVRTMYLQWEGEGEGEGGGGGGGGGGRGRGGGRGARMRQNMAQPVLKVGAATSPAPLKQHFRSAYGHAMSIYTLHRQCCTLQSHCMHTQRLCNFSEYCLQVGVDIWT